MTTLPETVVSGLKSRGRLLQILGVWFGIAAAIGNTIAAGIVRTPGDIAARLPNAWLFLGVWVGGALYAMLGAFQLAELGAAIPRSGGQYNYSRRPWGIRRIHRHFWCSDHAQLGSYRFELRTASSDDLRTHGLR